MYTMGEMLLTITEGKAATLLLVCTFDASSMLTPVYHSSKVIILCSSAFGEFLCCFALNVVYLLNG